MYFLIQKNPNVVNLMFFDVSNLFTASDKPFIPSYTNASKSRVFETYFFAILNTNLILCMNKSSFNLFLSFLYFLIIARSSSLLNDGYYFAYDFKKLHSFVVLSFP